MLMRPWHERNDTVSANRRRAGMLSPCNEPFLPTVVDARIEREIAAQGIIPSAGVAKLADAQDLKSGQRVFGFDEIAQ